MDLTNLTDTTTLTLPDDLLWSDEHSWTRATAHVDYLLTGALLLEMSERQAGRPITLVGAPDLAWVTRVTVERLYAWANTSDLPLRLTLPDGRGFMVRFRHTDVAIEAEPVLGFPARSGDDWYRLTMRLMMV